MSLPSDLPAFAHKVIQWQLECDHRVTCGCRHVLGAPAYCWICHKFAKVTQMLVNEQPFPPAYIQARKQVERDAMRRAEEKAASHG